MAEEFTDGRVSRRFVATFIAIALIILAFILIKPYIAAVLTGMFLAYVFSVPYTKLNNLIKKPGISAAIVCFLVILVAGFAMYFIAQITVREAFNLYMSVQKLDIFNIINNILINTFNVAPELGRQIGLTLQQGAISLTNTFINSIGKVLTNAPQLFIQAFIVFFVFFYFLKEGKKAGSYIKEILPFSSDTNERFLKRSNEVAKATIYGQIAAGIIQGILSGILFYIFSAPSPLFFTLLAALLGILPFIGPWLVIIPVGLVMVAQGQMMAGLALMSIGVLMNILTGTFLSAVLVGKKGKANPVVMLVGMLGGLALVGPIGLVVGPLILEYLIIFIDLYKTGKIH